MRARYWRDPGAYKRQQKAALARRRVAGWTPPPRKRARDYLARKRATDKARRLRYKLAAFNAYGGASCACCSETCVEFLTLDHVNGKGNALRRAGEGCGERLYRKLELAGYPPGYQVLCMNCNWARRYDGVCPHRRS